MLYSVRVSNELGKGDSKAAKFSIVNVVLTSLALGIVLFIFFLFFREHLSYVFTNDRDVATEVAHLSPLLAFSILMNSVQPVLSGESPLSSLFIFHWEMDFLIYLNRCGDWGWMAEYCGIC